MSLCPRCGSILDGPRENPKTRRLGRKCPDCLDWQLLPATRGVPLAGRVTGRRAHAGRVPAPPPAL
jgi:hypothetical protein